MATLGFTDSDGVDVGNKYVTKDYVMTWYPNLVSSMVAPQLWTWGYNNAGQAGDSTIVDKSIPVQTTAGGTNWRQVSVGDYYTGSIKNDGTLWTWGTNTSGQLGDNTAINKSSPVQTVAGGTNWKSISCGYACSAAIKTDGTLWMWGYNGYGQLGISSTTGNSSPVQTVTGGTSWSQVSASSPMGNHVSSIKTDGTLWSWGRNDYGQLGDNTSSHKSSPVQTVAGGTNWKTISAGNLQTAAIKVDGTLWVWGRNNYGQLGTNDTIDRSSPIQTTAGGTTWKQISVGWLNMASIKTDGTLWTWGIGNGQNGTGDLNPYSSPVMVSGGGTNWKYVDTGYIITAAIKTDGTLWTFGQGVNNGLGKGNTSAYLTPTQIYGGGTNWRQVSMNIYAGVAISEASGW